MRENWALPRVDLNIVSGCGGLGDQLARLPAYRFLEENHKHVYVTVYVQDYFLDLARFLLPETERRSYRKLSEAPWELKKPICEFDPDRVTTLQMHLTDHAFVMLMDTLPPDQASRAYVRAKEYLWPHFSSGDIKIFNNAEDMFVDKTTELYEGLHVVFTTDYTAPSRAWPAVHVNTLARKVREAGLTPVLLGTKEPIQTGVVGDNINPTSVDGLKLDLFIDLRGKTTLIEALGVIQRAKAVVGVDNGLLHLAHCTDTPVVMGFTTLKPEHRVPVRMSPAINSDISKGYSDYRCRRGAQLTKVLESLIPCKGCQSRGFAINHDWRTCLFDDYACTLTLTGDRFYEKLQELGIV